MGKVLIIARKDMKEAFRSKTTYLYVLFLFLIVLPYFDGLRSTMSSFTKQGLSPAESRDAIQAFLNTFASTLPLVLTMLFCSFLSGYAIIMDKTKRTLESLLATSLNLRQVWIGKSLAVALPSIGIMFFVLLLTLILLNQLFIIPSVGTFIIPSALSLVTSFIIIPIMVCLLVLIVSFLQLIMANPRIANFAYIVIFLGIYMVTITELTASWDISLVYLAVTVLLAIAAVFLNRFLTKEKVILSSKG